VAACLADGIMTVIVQINVNNCVKNSIPGALSLNFEKLVIPMIIVGLFQIVSFATVTYSTLAIRS